jgi:uncharacterized damage-inducible protein DinB
MLADVRNKSWIKNCMDPNKTPSTEPWLRGTLTDVPAVPRAVLHALELAREDITRWAGHLTDSELHQRTSDIPPVAFQLRHIARSLDRLLTYAEGRALDPLQIDRLRSETAPEGTRQELFDEFIAALDRSAARVRKLATSDLNSPRTVGKQHLPTTLGGLLVHVADHTQRHVGQVITTAKFIAAGRLNDL